MTLIKARLRNRIFHLAVCLLLCAAPLPAAEEETLLTITGNLIGKLDNLSADATAATVTGEYYALLPATAQQRLDSLRRDMERRAEDYLFAFRSGDTAEMNERLEDLSFYWASIRTIHAQEFTGEVIDQLNKAYGDLYEFTEGL